MFAYPLGTCYYIPEGNEVPEERGEAAERSKEMRKSNSKEARRAVEKYVREFIDARLEDYNQADSLRPITSAFNIMRDEMRYQSDQTENGYPVCGVGLAKKHHDAGYYGYITADTPYWIAYLAVGAGCFDCSYYDQRRAVASWLDETPEEADRYSNEQVYRQYRHMFSKAFERLHERENTPHKVNTAEFIALYQQKNRGHFFDPDTLKFFGQTRRSFSVYAFELVTDSHDQQPHDCYAVYHTIKAPTGEKFPRVAYFDRVTLEQVFSANA